MRDAVVHYVRGIIDSAFAMSPSATKEALRRKGYVHISDELAMAPLSTVQRVILDANIWGCGVITRSDDGTLSVCDPKMMTVVDMEIFQSIIDQLGAGTWSEEMRYAYYTDPLFHALMHMLLQSKEIPTPC